MNNAYNKDWQNNKFENTITISKDYFEHLLNCLANQKFIRELPPNADALGLGKETYNNIQKENQKKIDMAWRQGMFILSLDSKQKIKFEELSKRYYDSCIKLTSQIKKYAEDDRKTYPEDQNINFKWTQLVTQEIEMWISLCCSSDSIIDYENESYEHGQVSLEDFVHIVLRRGFTPNMIGFLITILKDVGIGNNLDSSIIKERMEKETISTNKAITC